MPTKPPTDRPVEAYSPGPLPKWESDSHKGDHGHALVLGGSLGMSGAPRLAGLAALTAGAGRVTMLVPDAVASAVATESPELMVFPAPSTQQGQFSFAALSLIASHLKGKDALVVGPGLGRGRSALLLIKRVLERFEGPVVVDADALLACRDLVQRPNRIFTPHQGEAARLLETTADVVGRNRSKSATMLQKELGGCVVLKGRGTLIADATSLVRIDVGNASLGKAGSGDVLSGVIVALLAQGLPPGIAAATGAWIHGRAADRLHPEQGDRGLTPRRLIDALPGAMVELTKTSR